jgi:hypothetical protein
MYNEPNGSFWKPKPHVRAYSKLALAVGRAIRQAEPGETYIGPASARIDFRFLESCFQAGLLEYWSAISVHPYRQEAPETVAADYVRLRRLIDQYAPKGKKIPILAGEWGYSSAWKRMDGVQQGKMLPRQWLTNLANGVPLSIWYDWHDDGSEPAEAEHHFGTVAYPYHEGRQPVYDPKPAYQAAKTLAHVLEGFQFTRRLAVGKDNDYVLVFTKPGHGVRLVAWTTSAAARTVRLPARAGASFKVISHTGGPLPALTAGPAGIATALGDAPVYLLPEGPDACAGQASFAPRRCSRNY